MSRDDILAARISIHAAREGGDLPKLMLDVAKHFISIHAAREGGDCCFWGSYQYLRHFNPRRP